MLMMLKSEYKKHFLETIQLAYPVAIGQLGHVMFGVIDSIMVGRIGSSSLAAASLVTSLFFLIVVFGIGMTLAITPLVAIARGANKKSECGIILRQGLIVNSLVSVILLITTFLLSDYIFLLNQPREVTIRAESYLKILSFSVLPFMLFQTYRQFIEGLSFTRPAMYIVLIANLLNAGLNWILIYGKFGFPGMGLDGAGIATTLTRIFMAVMLIVFVQRSENFKEFNPVFSFRNPQWGIIRKLVGIGLPSGLQYFFEISAFSIAAIMIGWLGSVALAAHQIAINLASVTYMIILGISAAGTIRVGNAVGRNNYGEVLNAGLTAASIAAGVMACFGILFVILRNQLPLIYISEMEVVETASGLLIVAAIFQVFDGLQATGIGILRGITDVKVPMYISFVTYWAVALPAGYFLSFRFNLGVTGIWIGLSLGLILAAISFITRFVLRTKKRQFFQF